MKKYIFTAILLLYLVGNCYVFYGYSPIVANTTVEVQILFVLTAVILTFSILLFFAIGKRIPVYLASALYKVGTGWFMLTIQAFLVTAVCDLARLVNTLLVHSDSWFFDAHSPKRGALLVGITLFIAFIGHVNYLKKRRIELNLKVDKKLPRGLKIVLLTDMHLGYAIENKELKSWVNLVNEEQADVVLIAGDIIDVSLLPLHYFQLDKVLKQFKSKYGTYACVGNHEYLSGIERSIEFLKSGNITVLRDKVVSLDDLHINIVGRDDKTNLKRKSLSKVVEGINDEYVNILLDHQPYNLESATENKIDLQFSGHTHRGQMWPISWITDRLFENSYGYLKKGDTQYYVSSGIGIWGGRYRVGTQSEYVVINVVGKKE